MITIIARPPFTSRARHHHPRTRHKPHHNAVGNHHGRSFTATTNRYLDYQGLRTATQAGHTIPSLCEADNNRASSRGLLPAYALWRDDTIGHLQEAAAAFHHVTGLPHNDMFLAMKEHGSFILPMEHGRGLRSDHIVNLNPGKIVRQVLGMLLAVQHTSYLLDSHPQLAAAYHSDEPASIEPFTLHVALANGGLGYFRDAVMSVSIDISGQAESSSIDFWAVAFPPFLIFLANGPKAPIEATRIDQWLDYPVNVAFNKRDRKVSYPIADPRELLVAKIYQDQYRLDQMTGGQL